MTVQSQQAAEMMDLLPEQERNNAFESVKKIFLTWDHDYTKLTPFESEELKKAEESGYIDSDEIDWDNLDQYSEE